MNEGIFTFGNNSNKPPTGLDTDDEIFGQLALQTKLHETIQEHVHKQEKKQNRQAEIPQSCSSDTNGLNAGGRCRYILPIKRLATFSPESQYTYLAMNL
ncbi:hypothetical protein CAEBREN_15871 [Caenorhabditis brenneri]|uniref:Uncharacterized protein n=1 Tax=Caenorhabditis brenneri TaxID=135651 RepID=G0NHZ4_CAEBE|nr:hypothetical protein CAEBREN_15871 [Caenorhabditis brenneri]